MRNSWVGQNRGIYGIGLSAISPYFFPQRKLLNLYFLPKRRDLPQEDMLLYWIRFSFGDTPGTTGLAALDTQNQAQQVKLPTYVWGISGGSRTLVGTSAGFIFQLYHTIGQNRRWIFNKHVSDVEVLGNGQHPQLFPRPYLLLPQDSIECEVKNMSTPTAPNLTTMGVTLHCAQVISGDQP